MSDYDTDISAEQVSNSGGQSHPFDSDFQAAQESADVNQSSNVEVNEYDALVSQREELERKIQEARARQLEGTIKEIHVRIAQFGLLPSDVFPEFNFSRKRNMSSAAPKYRDPATGATWTGRGKAPAWIADKEREQFAI